MKSAPYDNRNQSDYIAVTEKIDKALRLMEKNKDIPSTEIRLAELAGCSRGTLRNRVYPLAKLKEKKKAEKILVLFLGLVA